MWLSQGPYSAEPPRRVVSNESGGVGRIGRPTIEVLGAEDEMAKRRVRKFPNRKISETFLHFAAPLLHDLPSEAPERRAREALQVSFTAWNAVIFADVLNDHTHLNEVRRLTVSAGIKQQHFRRFCSSKEAPHWRGRGTHST